MGVGGSGGSIDEGIDMGYGSMVDVPDIIKRTQSAGRELLRRFAYAHACRLGSIVRRAMTTQDGSGWLAAGEPREVRLAVQLLLEDVAATRKLVACTLGEWDAAAAAAVARALGMGAEELGAPAAAAFKPGAGASPAALSARRTGMVVGAAGVSSAYGGLGAGAGAGGFGAGGFGAGGRGAFGALDVDRLFREGAGGGGGGGGGPPPAASRLVLGFVDYSAESVAGALLRCTFKALVEWTRASSLGPGGYQQLQADVAALHLALPFFVNNLPAAAAAQAAAAGAAAAAAGGAGAAAAAAAAFDAYAAAGPLEELLNEAAVSAGERCTEPRPLEVAILYALATGKLAKLNLSI